MKHKLFKDNNLVHAVVNCDYEEAKQILQNGNYDKESLADVGGFCKPFPVYMICVCIEIILGDCLYKCAPYDAIYERNKKILEMLCADTGFKNQNIIIEDYIEHIYGDKTDPEEIFCADECFEDYCKSGRLDELKKYNITEIDLKLYYAVFKLKSYHAIKKYCELGGRPKWNIEGVNSPIDYFVDKNTMDIFRRVTELLQKPEKEEFNIHDIFRIVTCARDVQNMNLLDEYCR